VSLVVEYVLNSFLPAWFPPAVAPIDLSKFNMETAEDVGGTLVIESGTVNGDSIKTAMLLNDLCASVQKTTGLTNVARVMQSRPVDASAPILSLRLNKSAIRCNGKLFTPADVPKLLPCLQSA
jgi:hypothetical protein